MLFLIFSFYLSSLEPFALSGAPLHLFNPLLIPYIYYDSTNDFSPNYFYKNLNIKFKEPDSQNVMSRFLLYRSILSTEQNTVSSSLPLFKGEVNSLFYFSLWRNKTTFDFSQHNYFFKLKSKKIPVTLSFSQFDSNPDSERIFIRDFSISLKFLPFMFLYSRESGKYIKEKFGVSFQNLFKNFFYKFSYTQYNFLLSHRRILKDFEINFKLPYFFAEIHTGNESEDGERYSINSGFDFKFLKISYFMEKLLFPFPFDSLRDTLNYEKPVRRKGGSINVNFKNRFMGLEMKVNYFKAKNLLIIDPLEKLPFLYSGNLFDIFSSDSVEFFGRLILFAKYRMITGEHLKFDNLNTGFKFFILKNELKNYFVYLKGSFHSFNKNYLWRISITGDFYSYLMIHFSYSQPAGGNYFYPEDYAPFPYYSIKITANVPD